MHIFKVAFYTSSIYYALFIDRSTLLPFLSVLVIYLIASAHLPNAKDLSIRNKIMNATWNHPSQGNIIVRVPVRVQKVQKITENLPRESRPSLTHFAIKALGEVLSSQSSLNGNLAFGKFFPYESVDVSCLVDIGNGKDLTVILLKGVNKMSVEGIALEVRSKASEMKKNDGGKQHVEQTKPLKFAPACIVEILVQVISFVANKLGISVPSLKIQKHAFGAACVIALGPLGFEDATAPFTDFANCTVLLSANAVMKKPVVQGDKVVVGQVMNCNFVVEHRYVDEGNCTKLVEVFRSVFENPELFLRKQQKDKKQD